MICPMVPFPLTLSDPSGRFQGHGVRCPQRRRYWFVCTTEARSVCDS